MGGLVALGSMGALAYLGSEGAPLLPSFAQASDPNLFALNWELVTEALLAVVLLAFVIERGLAPLFESRWFVKLDELREKEGKGTFKPLIAFMVAAAGCVLWQFDALSIILTRDTWTVMGAALTGAVVAGGSKASLKLFRDVLEIKSSAVSEREERAKQGAEQTKPEGAPAGTTGQAKPPQNGEGKLPGDIVVPPPISPPTNPNPPGE
jgi:hypothetical protein